MGDDLQNLPMASTFVFLRMFVLAPHRTHTHTSPFPHTHTHRLAMPSPALPLFARLAAARERAAAARHEDAEEVARTHDMQQAGRDEN